MPDIRQQILNQLADRERQQQMFSDPNQFRNTLMERNPLYRPEDEEARDIMSGILPFLGAATEPTKEFLSPDTLMEAILYLLLGSGSKVSKLGKTQFLKSPRGWKELGEYDKKLQDNIGGWLQGLSEKPLSPEVIYRGIPKGTTPRVEKGITHATPWGSIASRGGKGAFGVPSQYTVYQIPTSPKQLYYRGGSMTSSPLESTRIMNERGMTWDQVLDEAKDLFSKRSERHINRISKMNPDYQGYNIPLDELRRDAIQRELEHVLNDIRNATFETDVTNKLGQWSTAKLPSRANRPLPQLLMESEIMEALKQKRKP